MKEEGGPGVGSIIPASPPQQLGGFLSKTLSSLAVAEILDFFFDHKEFDYSPAEIAKKTGLSSRTIFRELPSLERYLLICISRKIGKTNMYRLNSDLGAVAYLERFSLEMSQIVTTSRDGSDNATAEEVNNDDLSSPQSRLEKIPSLKK